MRDFNGLWRQPGDSLYLFSGVDYVRPMAQVINDHHEGCDCADRRSAWWETSKAAARWTPGQDEMRTNERRWAE